tara:strand:- start:501 stop:620 length:120 start_codon:yes stop_codon:yes gene_type:complete
MPSTCNNQIVKEQMIVNDDLLPETDRKYLLPETQEKDTF